MEAFRQCPRQVLLLLAFFLSISKTLGDSKSIWDILEISNELINVETTIEKLNTTTNRYLNLTANTKQIFIAVQGKLSELQNTIIDQKTNIKHSILQMNLDNLMEYSETLKGKIQIIQKHLEERGEFLKAIQNFNFTEGKRLWASINMDPSLAIFVCEIYANNPNDIEIFLDFTKSLTELRCRVFIVSTLHKDLVSSGRLDSILTMKIIQALGSIDECNGTQNSEALDIYNSLLAKLKTNSTDWIVSEMLYHRFQSNAEMNILLIELYKFNSSVSNEIMFGSIDRVYGRISNNEILDSIYLQCYVPQREDAFVYMFEKMNSTKQLDTSILKLAKYVSYLRSLQYAPDLAVAKRHKNFESIWLALPTFIKDLYTANSVCIKNAGKSEYLYAASEDYSFDEDHRHVFSWIPRIKVSQAVWYVVRQIRKDSFQFISKEHYNEYLYASDEGIGLHHHYSFVFTKNLEGQVQSQKGTWNVEIFDNQLLIRSAFSKKLLCVTYKTYNDDRRYVFTLNTNFYAKEKNCLWVLEPCD